MNEVVEAKSSSEQNNDRCEGSTKVTIDQNKANSGQENNDLLVDTSSKDGGKSDLTDEVKDEYQNTPTDRNTTHIDYNLTDSDDYDCNITDSTYRYSDDSDESGDSGCSRGNNNADWHVKDSDIDQSNNHTIVHDSVHSKNKDNESEKIINDDDSSSSDETTYISSQVTVNDDGESNKTKDVPSGASNEKKELSSNNEEKSCITSQSTFNEGRESTKTEVVSAGPSNERKDQVKLGTKTKAERKEIYSVPLKKLRKF